MQYLSLFSLSLIKHTYTVCPPPHFFLTDPTAQKLLKHYFYLDTYCFQNLYNDHIVSYSYMLLYCIVCSQFLKPITIFGILGTQYPCIFWGVIFFVCSSHFWIKNKTVGNVGSPDSQEQLDLTPVICFIKQEHFYAKQCL